MTDYYAVAGLGRSGTTMLVRSISRNLRENGHAKEVGAFVFALTINNGDSMLLQEQPIYDFNIHSKVVSMTSIPYSKIEEEPWDKFRMHRFFKTHAFPPDMKLPKNFKLIWMFGNPMNIVLSAEKERYNNKDIDNWLKLHYINSHSPYYENHKDIYISDTLLLEKHFDAWYKSQPFEFLSLRYETLYNPEVRKGLNEFLGFKLELESQRQRSTDWRLHPRRAELEDTYKRLNSKIEAADDIKHWKPQ